MPTFVPVTSWYAKAALQGAMSQLRHPQKWNRLFQRYVSRRLSLNDDMVERKVSTAFRHLELIAAVTGDARAPGTMLELGTGWFPIVPAALTAAGVQQVITVDSTSLLREEEVIASLEAVRRVGPSYPGWDPSAASRIDDALAMPRGTSVVGRLDQLGIHAVVADARDLRVAPGSVDAFISNETLEHIPGDSIRAILSEFARVARARGAVMSHHIDMSDHYWHFDKRLNPYHFLRFDERRWRWFNNELQFQNRLRLPDYRSLHTEAGWTVVGEHGLQRDMASLRTVTLAEPFRSYDEDELAVHSAWIVSRVAP